MSAASALVVSVRLHDDRYHGAKEWPPSPARLFQALVAGAGLGGPLGAEESRALTWLERLEPPAIAAPPMWEGRSFRMYVPNNDLDSVRGDLRRVGKIRTDKGVKPRLIDERVPFLYAWPLDGNEEKERNAQAICALAERLYQFGRGIDMAWAWGEVVDGEQLEARLARHPGGIYRPAKGGNGITLACPGPGSLASLRERHEAKRFAATEQVKTVRLVFAQPPKPRFRPFEYESPPWRRVFDLRAPTAEMPLVAWPLARSSALVSRLRDGAVERLRTALPRQSADVERFLVGRKADGRDEGPTSERVRIVPLPSIGDHHADRGIRRVLVEVPPNCPLRADDVHWAFSGLEPVDVETGEALGVAITPAADESMLNHYGVGEEARHRLWRTVTPAALPEAARRRRVDPATKIAGAKGGSERLQEHGRVAAEVLQAVRHAGVRQRVEAIRVQREPFEARGERTEAFAQGTRFAKQLLQHVEIAFAEPMAGPLVIGDGRFLGLGVMRPVRRSQGVYPFVIESGLAATPQPTEIARALRRAVMARVQEVLGARNTLSSFFSGHEGNGSPAQTGRSSHLSFLFDRGSLGVARLLVVAPHVVERRDPTGDEVRCLRHLEAALLELRELRAGSAGHVLLRPSVIDGDSDPLFAPSRTWESVTPYIVTRHSKRVGAADALSADLREECRRRRLPQPRVTPRELRGVPGVGLVGDATLAFEVAVPGPIVLGRSRHLGGGLFITKPLD